MEAEGMVHALEEIQRLIKSGGCLIDIHPVRGAPLIKVYQRGDILFAEPDPGYNYDESLSQAEDALAAALQRAVFNVAGEDKFDLITYASSVAELREYWLIMGAYDNSPKDVAMTTQQTEVFDRIDKIIQSTRGTAEVAYHERGRIMRLEPNKGG